MSDILIHRQKRYSHLINPPLQPLIVKDEASLEMASQFLWLHLVDYSIYEIVHDLFDDELEKTYSCGTNTETYVYTDETDLDVKTSHCHHPLCCRHVENLVSSINVNNYDELVDLNSFQVEVVDEKMTRNMMFEKLVDKSLSQSFSLKCFSANVGDRRKYSFDFLVKTDKLGDDIINLLHNHKINKQCNEFNRREPIKDRRLISIEQSNKCVFDFPTDLKICRYKGVNCTKIRVISSSEMNNVKVLNLLKNKLPKMYSECIFTGDYMRKYRTALEFSTSSSPARKCYLLERPSSLLSSEHSRPTTLTSNLKKTRSASSNSTIGVLNSVQSN